MADPMVTLAFSLEALFRLQGGEGNPRRAWWTVSMEAMSQHPRRLGSWNL